MSSFEEIRPRELKPALLELDGISRAQRVGRTVSCGSSASTVSTSAATSVPIGSPLMARAIAPSPPRPNTTIDAPAALGFAVSAFAALNVPFTMIRMCRSSDAIYVHGSVIAPEFFELAAELEQAKKRNSELESQLAALNAAAADKDKLAAVFNPTKFDADAWVQAAKDAGMGYLVITAMTAVQPPAAALRRLDAGLMLAGFAVGLASLASGFGVIAAGGRESGMAFPLFMFAVVGLLAAAGDFRMLRSGGLRGAARLARHLWRMCVALWIAAASFFLGQADEFPEALRIPGLLALPVLAVLVAMFYWLWRVRGGWLAGGRQGLQVP